MADLMNFMRDGLWQFVGVVLALLALIITIIIYFKQKAQKLMSYAVLSNTSIVNLNEEVESKVQIFYEKKQVNNVNLAMIKIWNSGTVPIVPTDYINPIIIQFDEFAEILEVELLETNPDDLDVKFKKSINSIELMPLLLNGKDSIKIKALVSNGTGAISINARIAGVNKITRGSGSKTGPLAIFSFLPLIAMAILVPLQFIVLPKSWFSENSTLSNVFSWIYMFIIAYSVFSIYYRPESPYRSEETRERDYIYVYPYYDEILPSENEDDNRIEENGKNTHSEETKDASASTSNKNNVNSRSLRNRKTIPQNKQRTRRP